MKNPLISSLYKDAESPLHFTAPRKNFKSGLPFYLQHFGINRPTSRGRNGINASVCVAFPQQDTVLLSKQHDRFKIETGEEFKFGVFFSEGRKIQNTYGIFLKYAELGILNDAQQFSN